MNIRKNFRFQTDSEGYNYHPCAYFLADVIQIATPSVARKVLRLKAERPSLFAGDIRELLLGQRLCDPAQVPSVSSINRILREAATATHALAAEWPSVTAALFHQHHHNHPQQDQQPQQQQQNQHQQQLTGKVFTFPHCFGYLRIEAEPVLYRPSFIQHH